MNVTGYDFSGWATKPNLLCADGRVILNDAFKGDSGKKVPLVYNHIHDTISEVLGHAILEAKDGGMYAYCFFNNTESGRNAKESVKHGDITSLSIYANGLKQSGRNVIHGAIRELSIVLAGANPGAVIDDVLEHSDDGLDGEAIIDVGYENADILVHAEKEEEPEEAKKAPEAEKKEEPVEDKEETKKESSDKTVGEVLATLNDEQKKAVAIVIGQAIADSNESKDDDEDEEEKDEDNAKEVKHSGIDNEGDYDMHYNVFETAPAEPILSREAQKEFIEHALQAGKSLKAAVTEDFKNDGVLAHAITDHNNVSITEGIANADYLFPDARTLNPTPEMISGDMTWVDKVINGTHHTPFSRIKSIFADITGEDARARGYVKGNQKVSEVIELLQRETTPQTIYKLQKFDRDDVLDMTGFDVIAWIKAEMQLMLKAEIARAILIGDGRTAGNDKIKEVNVRPIYNDADLFTVKVPVNVAANATTNVIADTAIDAIIRSRRLYKGSGNPAMFIDETYLADMLLLKDGMGRRIYETRQSLAAALNVKELIGVDVMENKKLTVNSAEKPLIGIIVNLQDYNVGADKGGQTSFFDDFDINFNKMEYLYETRMSGALIKPYSAMSIYLNQGA